MSNILRFYAYKAASVLAYCAPLAVLFAVNHKQYMKEPGFFGYIIIMFAALMAKNKLTEYSKKNIVLTISLVVFVVSLVMQYLASQLLLISAVSVGGCLLHYLPDQVADAYFYTAYKIEGNRKQRIASPTLSHKNAWRTVFHFSVKEV